MKDKIIRILCIVAAALSVVAIIPVMFEFFEYSEVFGAINFSGIALYTNKNLWYFIFIGVLGFISLLWNLVYGAYAILDGRYRNLTWKIARYGYFYGVVIGIINFAAIIAIISVTDSLPASWFFIVFLAAVVAVEIVLLILKDEDTKSKSSAMN